MARALRSCVASALGVDAEVVFIAAVVDAASGFVTQFFADDEVNVMGNDITVAAAINAIQERLLVPSATSSETPRPLNQRLLETAVDNDARDDGGAGKNIVRALAISPATIPLALPLRLPNASSPLVRAAAKSGGALFCLSIFTGVVGTVLNERGLALIAAANALSNDLLYLQNRTQPVIEAYVEALGSDGGASTKRPSLFIDNASTAIVVAPAIRVGVPSPKARAIEANGINSLYSNAAIGALGVAGAIVAVLFLAGVAALVRSSAARRVARARVVPAADMEKSLQVVQDGGDEGELEDVTIAEETRQVSSSLAHVKRTPLPLDEEEIAPKQVVVTTFDAAAVRPTLPFDALDVQLDVQSALVQRAHQLKNRVAAHRPMRRSELGRRGLNIVDNKSPTEKKAPTWKAAFNVGTNSSAPLGVSR